MKASISWWNLDGSNQTIESMRHYLEQEGVEPWFDVDGMILKFWISDPKTNRWGAVMLRALDADQKAPMPPNRALELIGYPPAERTVFEVDAVVGSSLLQGLARLGISQDLPRSQ